MSPAHLTAFICYRDPEAMIAWIADVLGFDVVRTFQDDGRLAHAELRCGDAVVCVQRDDRGYDVPAVKGDCVGSGLYVVVDADDVSAIHDRAWNDGAPRTRDHALGELPRRTARSRRPTVVDRHLSAG